MKTFWFKKALKIAAITLIFVLIMGGGVMVLWNWLIPPLFNGPMIGFGQAMGLLLLSKVLFGGVRGSAWRGGWGCQGSGWRHRMTERWEKATPEERERWKQRWGKNFDQPGTETA